MIISLNWLKKYTDINLPIDELTTLIGARLVEIEETIDLAEKYKNILIVRAVSVEKLAGSDHLSLVKIDDGQKTVGIERDENNLIQVVCGAPNITTGQTVVWLPPNVTVPTTFGSNEPFVLGSRKLCGYISNGMIASGKELDLSDDHEGILVLADEYQPGTSFAETFELNDVLLDIANKSLTHRPDCFGIIGFAREVAAIQGLKFTEPDVLSLINDTSFNGSMELSVSIDEAGISDRYTAITMSDVDASKKSPFDIQTYLSRVGVRPINAVVDVTNYLMMLTGQPLHAFDYDKLIALNNYKADIHVRSGKQGEKLELLDGRVIELATEDIVIASGDIAIGLAGAMGGVSTNIDENTKNIIIESATFNLYNLRSTQMRHGIFSEAITRFTKGQPSELSYPVLLTAVDLMQKWAGAKISSEIKEDYKNPYVASLVPIKLTDINGILGSDFDELTVRSTLENVGFKVASDMTVTAPYWRADIHIKEDVIEEIGRLNGFDNVNPVLPIRDFTAVKPSTFDDMRRQIRKILVRSGANEVFTVSTTS